MVRSRRTLPRRHRTSSYGSSEIDTLIPCADPIATTAPIVATLSRAIDEPDTSSLGAARAFAALAIVDPRACLEAACRPDGLRDRLTAADFSSAVATAIGASHERDAFGPRIFARDADRLTADAALEVAATLAADALDPSIGIAFARLVERFPTHPGILRAAVKHAASIGDGDRLDDLLTRLGYADRSPATAGFVQRQRDAARPAPRGDVRVAFLSSYTIDGLVPHVDLTLRALGLRPQFYVAPFNSWTRDVVDESSGLRAFEPDIAFLAVSIDDLVPDLAHLVSEASLDAAARSAVDRVADVASAFAERYPGVPLVVHDFHSAFAGPLGILDGRDGPSRTQWLAATNAMLAGRLRALPAAYLLDVAATVARAGAALADNPKLRHLAAMRLGPSALPHVADAYARYVAPLRGLTKKCVVLDLDNTLWGGVVGEDGKDGIRLGNTSPGSEFVEFQAFLKTLAARGILLALNSKNNAADALDVIRTHEAMVLREDDFSAVRINWLPKSENLIAIALELNVGVDALIFVDDNPDERERMRQLVPSALTVEMPKDPALYRSVLERLPELQTLAVTQEDAGRVDRYREIRLRDEAKGNAGSVEAYLRSLEIAVEIDVARPATFARVAQLFAKTNQFNVTTRRYSVADVERFAGDPGYRLWTLRSRDRFGDHGLVAVALLRVGEEAWTIDSFLMSCRVIGYGIESALLAHVCDRAREAGARTAIGEFVATAKNAPALDLYERHGFIREPRDGDVGRWRLALAESDVRPMWISVTRHDA